MYDFLSFIYYLLRGRRRESVCLGGEEGTKVGCYVSVLWLFGGRFVREIVHGDVL